MAAVGGCHYSLKSHPGWAGKGRAAEGRSMIDECNKASELTPALLRSRGLFVARWSCTVWYNRRSIVSQPHVGQCRWAVNHYAFTQSYRACFELESG